MNPRKSRDVIGALEKKGFALNPKKAHHAFYYLMVDGRRSNIYTYFSHGARECSGYLMGMIKKQMCFPSAEKADLFFDCDMDGAQYVDMLKELGHL